MITITDLFFSTLRWLLDLLPDANLTWIDFMNPYWFYVDWVGQIVNLTALVFTISLIVSYETVMLTVRGSLWVWRRLPFTGG